MRHMWGRLFVCVSFARSCLSADFSFAASFSGGFPVPFDTSLAAYLSPRLRPYSAVSNSIRSRSNSTMGKSSVDTTTAARRLEALRLLLQAQQLDGIIVDDSDAHGSEIPASAFAGRTFLSSFSGSNGLALVSREAALLWTDGRSGFPIAYTHTLYYSLFLSFLSANLFGYSCRDNPWSRPCSLEGSCLPGSFSVHQYLSIRPRAFLATCASFRPSLCL